MAENQSDSQEATLILSGTDELPETSEETAPLEGGGNHPQVWSRIHVSRREKLRIWFRYLAEYVRYGDWGSILASANYLVRRKTPGRSRLVRSRLGLFFCRARTTDFMFPNYAYEIRLKEFINRHAAGMNVYLDIGSCIGDYSIWLAQKGCRCHAFEPVPENFNMLKVNVLINALEGKIALHNFGLGREARKVRFHVREDNKGASTVDRKASGAEEGDIEIRRLDDVAPALGIGPEDRVLIKIDVEGMELDVLEGGRGFIAGLKDVVIISEATLSDRDAIVRVLDRIGGFAYHDVDEMNFAAVRRGTLSPAAPAQRMM